MASPNAKGAAAVLRVCGGYTMIEFLFAILLGGIIITAIVGLSIYTGKAFACLANYADMQASGMTAMERVTREIRAANGVTALSTNSITMTTDSGGPITYTYSSANRNLTRTQSGVTTTVLSDCDAAQFLAYQRTPIAGSFNQYAVTTDTNQVKAVFLNWTCSRTVLGNKLTTDSASAGKIVIRVN